MALAGALAIAGCGPSETEKAAEAAKANLAVVLDPAQGSGVWFICDALNAPTVIQSSRPDAGGEVTVLNLDKAGMHPPSAKRYKLGAAQETPDGVVRTLSLDGAEVGHVRTLAASALPDPAAVTTAPVVEVKLDEATLSCRWLAHTRLVGLTTGRVVTVTAEAEGPVYRTFEFKDAEKAQALNPGAAQRSSTPSLEIKGGRTIDENYAFTNGAFTYSVGEGGITTLENGRVTSGEPFVGALTVKAPG